MCHGRSSDAQSGARSARLSADSLHRPIRESPAQARGLYPGGRTRSDCQHSSRGASVMKVSTKVALVTGSGKRRVGWHVANALASRGYALAIHYHHSAAEATETVGYL